jgi:hypothetical protein
MKKWVTDYKYRVIFTSNGSNITPLLFRSNLPTTVYNQIMKMCFQGDKSYLQGRYKCFSSTNQIYICMTRHFVLLHKEAEYRARTAIGWTNNKHCCHYNSSSFSIGKINNESFSATVVL